MTTYITRLNSFDEVAAWYAKTRVLKSKNHPAEQDVRPIGDRSRKWERIIRVDPNTYAFSCGGQADPVFNWGPRDKLKDHPLQPEDIARLSPIVWRRHEDGTETVTVRNAQGEWSHQSWYSFLHRALPYELWFRINRQGRQAIYNRSEGKEYYLPKTKTVPRHIYEYHKERVAKGGGDWAKKYLNGCQVEFDNLSLTFKLNKRGKFELAGQAPKEMVKRIRVDKGAKGDFKERIDSFYDWVLAMYPLMRGQLNWSFRNETTKRLVEIAKERAIEGYRQSWHKLFGVSEPSLIREILSDEQHPMRYEFGIAAMFEINDMFELTEKERHYENPHMSDEDFRKMQRGKMRSAYTRWINKTAGFSSAIKEEK